MTVVVSTSELFVSSVSGMASIGSAVTVTVILSGAAGPTVSLAVIVVD